MALLAGLISFAVPLLIGIYTYNYGRWAWRQGLRRGAAGLYLLALAAVLVPAWLVWQTQ